MSMTIEKAISELEGYIGVFDDIYDYELKELWPALQLAVDALREKAEREDPKPLNIEELLQMHGEPVYVTMPGKPHRNKWCIVNLTGPRPTLFCEEYTCDLFLVSGSAAKIYRHKPKEEKK